jgi:hypothetical protein
VKFSKRVLTFREMGIRARIFYARRKKVGYRDPKRIKGEIVTSSSTSRPAAYPVGDRESSQMEKHSGKEVLADKTTYMRLFERAIWL